MKHFRLCALTVALVAAASCSRTETLAKAAGTPAGKPLVPVALVSRADLASNTVLTAEFEPFQEVEVMAKVSGYVKSIQVDIGDRVREGQPIATLEIPEMKDDMTRAAASSSQSEAEIAAARDEITRAESSHQMAHLSFSRIQEVAKRDPGLVPLQEVDEIRSRDLIAEAQVAAARSRLRAAEQRLQVSRADQSRAQTMQNYVSISAPFAGTVTKRYANTGAMVQAGTASQSQAMPIIRLSQNSVLRLRLPVPESMVSSIRIGESVDVRVNSLGNRTFSGKVARTTGKVDQATRTMITEVDVENSSGLILPGMYAEVTLHLEHRNSVLSVPLEAVERSASGSRVFRVDPQGAVHIVTVRLGVEDSHKAEVLAGLNEGDPVVVAQRAGLREGESVRTKTTGTGSAN